MQNEMSLATAIRETRKDLIQAVNAHGLPIDVLDLIVRDFSNAIHAQAEAEYQSEVINKEAENEQGNKE